MSHADQRPDSTTRLPRRKACRCCPKYNPMTAALDALEDDKEAMFEAWHTLAFVAYKRPVHRIVARFAHDLWLGMQEIDRDRSERERIAREMRGVV